jgi:hypothetical protein
MGSSNDPILVFKTHLQNPENFTQSCLFSPIFFVLNYNSPMKSFFLYSTLFILAFGQNAYAIKKGERTNEDKYAAVVALPFCSGTFITPRIIITAAHCLPEFDSKYITVSSLDRSSSNQYRIDHVMPHPKYVPHVHSIYDVAYVLLKSAITDKKILQNLPIIDVEEIDKITMGSIVRAVGFGLDRVPKRTDPSDLLDQMVKKKLNLIIYKQDGINVMSKSSEANGGICPGDSGGGILLEKDNRIYYLGNSVAMEEYCGKENSLMFTANIKYSLDWIEESTKIKLRSTLPGLN